MNSAHSIKDQVKLREELNNSLDSATRKFEQRRRGFYRNLSGSFLDAFEDGDLKDIISKPAIALAKEGIDLLPEIVRSRRFTGVIDILDQAINVRQYSDLLNRAFGKKLDISQYEITEARKYQRVLESRYSIDFIQPR